MGPHPPFSATRAIAGASGGFLRRQDTQRVRLLAVELGVAAALGGVIGRRGRAVDGEVSVADHRTTFLAPPGRDDSSDNRATRSVLPTLCSVSVA